MAYNTSATVGLLAALLLALVPALNQAATISGTSGSSYILEELIPSRRTRGDELLNAGNHLSDTLTDSEVDYLLPRRIPREDAGLEEPGCPGCDRRQALERQLSAEQIRQARLELIKKQILEKLRMDKPPNVTARPRNLPEPLLAMEIDILREDTQQPPPSEEDFYGKTTEIIMFSDSGYNCHSTRPAGCFHISLKEGMEAEEVKAVDLYVYKPADATANQTLEVARLGSSNHRSGQQLREIVDIQDTTLKRGWIKFDVHSVINKWLRHPSSNHGLEVRCRDCAQDDTASPIVLDDDLKPFIVIHTRERQRRSRNKRDVTVCTSQSDTCCLESLTVNFTEIGFGDWILFPEEYVANFCRGSCNSPGAWDLDQPHHGAVMQRYLIAQRLGIIARPIITPCCAPTSHAPVSILVQDEQGNVIKRNLPDMQVTSCSCM